MKTYIKCNDCGKKTVNEGFGKCNGCVRKYKKRTRPSFFLCIAYSQIKSRATNNKQNRKYIAYNKKYCTKDEFFNKFLENKTFLKLFKAWQKRGYQQKYSPSFDRIDDSLGYEIDNIQIITNLENTIKGRSVPIKLKDIISGEIIKFTSKTKASKFLGCSISNIYLANKEKRLIQKRYEVICE